jgi:hypothetical protein
VQRSVRRVDGGGIRWSDCKGLSWPDLKYRQAAVAAAPWLVVVPRLFRPSCEDLAISPLCSEAEWRVSCVFTPRSATIGQKVGQREGQPSARGGDESLALPGTVY